MQDAFGGILSLVILAVFLLIVEGVLGLTVCYTKAFRMKNAIITTIEKYDGIGCFDEGKACNNKIIEEANKLAYSPSVKLNCNKGFKNVKNIFCYKNNTPLWTDMTSYHIITQVDVNFPIINHIMGLSIFQVNGDTRDIPVKKKKK